MAEKINAGYYIGLDIGTDSVGWAVTDKQYNIKRFNGKQMWGVHLFESGKTAEERRAFRSGRRTNARKKQRVALLKELFAEEITKKDPGFYQRLEDSRFFIEDKTVKQPNTLFFDPDYKDKDFHKKYPTIYHLRKALMDDKEDLHDIRLLYLAIAHILKNRGHFLYQGQNFEIGSAFQSTWDAFASTVNEYFPEQISCSYSNELQSLLKQNMSVSRKKEALANLLDIKKDNKQTMELLTLISGGTAKTALLFGDASLSSGDAAKISFSSPAYDDSSDVLRDILEDRMDMVDAAKALYDWSVLAETMKGFSSLSEAKIDSYNKHKSDLRRLKNTVKKYCGKDLYRQLFRDELQKDNYIAYIGKSRAKNNGSVCSQEDFYAAVRKALLPYSDNKSVSSILKDIEDRSFMPLQSSKENSVIPNQLHLAELEMILKNAEKHFDFLTEKDPDGITVCEKILSIMTFRIPYYVGPLNTYHSAEKGGNAWMIRKEEGTIRPWNFEEKVDLEASGELFIKRMTNTCTYLYGEDVLPKDSLLYSRFDFLNHINNLRINGERITVEHKQAIYEKLKYRKTIKFGDVRNSLISMGIMSESDELSGIDAESKISMKPWADFIKILGDELWDEALIEECIRTIVLFGDEKRAVRRRINSIAGRKLNEDQIKKICSLQYTGWGRLSRKFLTGIYSADRSTGEAFCIDRMLYETNMNLMQLLGSDYDFAKAVEEHNNSVRGTITECSYDSLVEPLYCSPAVKRGIWRTLNIVREIVKIEACAPDKIFIEMAREPGEKKRTVSRKQALSALYRSCKQEERNWMSELNALSESDLRKDKLYLYYTQMGRCMYSGEPISLSDLYNDNLYDIDHIYPQSLTKDDSLNNRVLVKKTMNEEKGNLFPVPAGYRNKCSGLWKMLESRGFITKEKYFRLTRTDGFTPEELSGFINRQLVETRQSTKAAAQVLQSLYGQTVVFSKAGNVADFRRDFGFVKVRELNDYHHAKDAYLNIVVGNVYDTKFTRNPINFIRNAKPGTYSLNRMYDYDVGSGNSLAWKSGKDGSISTVRKTMSGNGILYTRYSREKTGGFYKQKPMKKGSGQIPLKTSDPRFSNLERYGGYNKDATAYFFLVEYREKNRTVRSIECVPVRFAKKIADDKNLLKEYCIKELKLSDPRIIIERIKINTLFKLDGFPMHISGRTDNNLTFKCGVQLILPQEQETYLKKVVRFNERRRNGLAGEITAFDGITAEENILLYDILTEKQRSSVYRNRPASQLDVMVKGREKFKKLSVEDQCAAIINILELFNCGSASADLKAIGGSGQAGTLKKNKNISGCSQAEIIYQSVTGLFEKKINLLEL